MNINLPDIEVLIECSLVDDPGKLTREEATERAKQLAATVAKGYPDNPAYTSDEYVTKATEEILKYNRLACERYEKYQHVKLFIRRCGARQVGIWQDKLQRIEANWRDDKRKLQVEYKEDPRHPIFIDSTFRNGRYIGDVIDAARDILFTTIAKQEGITVNGKDIDCTDDAQRSLLIEGLIQVGLGRLAMDKAIQVQHPNYYDIFV